MGSDVFDGAVGPELDDGVSFPDGVQFVRYYQHCCVFTQLIDGRDNICFILRVQGRCGLIKQYDGCFFQQRARDGDALAFTPG